LRSRNRKPVTTAKGKNMPIKKMSAQIKEFKELIIMIIFFITTIGVMAKGFIDKRIDIKLNPVVEALEFQNFLMMESLPDTIVDRATAKYVNSQKGLVKK
jgi:hypothetical protein